MGWAIGLGNGEWGMGKWEMGNREYPIPPVPGDDSIISWATHPPPPTTFNHDGAV